VGEISEKSEKIEEKMQKIGENRQKSLHSEQNQCVCPKNVGLIFLRVWGFQRTINQIHSTRTTGSIWAQNDGNF